MAHWVDKEGGGDNGDGADSRDGPSISSSYRDGAYECLRRRWRGLERVWRTVQGTDRDESKE